MKPFKDASGRTWEVSIHVAADRRCRSLLKVNLAALVDDGFAGLGKLLSDPVELVDVLFVLCKDQADGLGVSDEDFGRSLGGDSLEAAAAAFVEELIDFFPDARRREAIRKVMAKSRTLAGLVMERAAARLDALDLETLLPRSTPSSGGVPESSASTPTPSPSGNSST